MRNYPRRPSIGSGHRRIRIGSRTVDVENLRVGHGVELLEGGAGVAVCSARQAADLSPLPVVSRVESHFRRTYQYQIGIHHQLDPRIGRRHHGQSCVNHRVHFGLKAPESRRGTFSDGLQRRHNSFQQSSVVDPDDQLVAGELYALAEGAPRHGLSERIVPHWDRLLDFVCAALVTQSIGSRSCRRYRSGTGGRAAPSWRALATQAGF
jgi:hypothetical protein